MQICNATTIQVQIKSQIAEGHPRYFEGGWISPETSRRWPRKIEYFQTLQNISEDFLILAEHYRRFPKGSKNYPDISEDFLRSPEDFPKIFQHYRKACDNLGNFQRYLEDQGHCPLPE